MGRAGLGMLCLPYALPRMFTLPLLVYFRKRLPLAWRYGLRQARPGRPQRPAPPRPAVLRSRQTTGAVFAPGAADQQEQHEGLGLHGA